MPGHYHAGLVALSIAIAILASYTALDLANRVNDSGIGAARARAWLVAGALSMGCGIWAMHFIGMLAFELPVPIAYNIPITIVSLATAVGVSALALHILRSADVSIRRLLIGAALMGAGISAMHYLGMTAMLMSPAISYQPLIFAASVLIAVLASFVALWIAFILRESLSRFAILAKLGSAVIMGCAIAGMHYTGMAAAHFAAGSICTAARAGGLEGSALAIIIGCIAVAIMITTLILSALDAHFAVRNSRLAASLQQTTSELQATQGQLVSSARKAGMAEIANSVLHNVGNVLNSVNISAGVIENTFRQSKIDGLAQGIQMLNEHSADLASFLTSDEKGRRLPGYLGKVALAVMEERRQLLDELAALVRSVEHIKDIVVTQQAYAGTSTVVEPVQVQALLDDALRMNSLSVPQEQVRIERDIDSMPKLLLDKHLVLQVLVNLISNAKHAIEGLPQDVHRITMRIRQAATADQEPRLQIIVEDDGAGIAPENMSRLFVHGFTTRPKGHGFGLHSSAIAAKSMGGTLTAHSDGPGRGAQFTLELPFRTAQAA